MFWIDKIFCLFIAWGGFTILQMAPPVSKLPPLAWHGVKIIAISAMLAVVAALFGFISPTLEHLSSHFSSSGINLGLCIILYAHYKMFNVQNNSSISSD